MHNHGKDSAKRAWPCSRNGLKSRNRVGWRARRGRLRPKR